tara:strand:- start:284 stop:955 length:672 start_codon:yes stop_codon:yes gene_type:complete
MRALNTIGFNAFKFCTSLTKVGDLSSLITIGEMAFHETALTQLGNLESLTTIRDRAFQGSQLAQLGDMAALTEIGNRAFEGTPLTQLGNLSSLTTIGDLAFYHTPLTLLGEMSRLTKIGHGAIYKTPLTQLGGLSSPTAVAFEGTQLAQDMPALSGDRAFEGTLLTQLGKTSLTNIGGRAFQNCTKLVFLSLPKELKTVGFDAFKNCPLRAITVGKGAAFDCY